MVWHPFKCAAVVKDPPNLFFQKWAGSRPDSCDRKTRIFTFRNYKRKQAQTARQTASQSDKHKKTINFANCSRIGFATCSLPTSKHLSLLRPFPILIFYNRQTKSQRTNQLQWLATDLLNSDRLPRKRVVGNGYLLALSLSLCWRRSISGERVRLNSGNCTASE